ncbi:MAG: transposase, partial [Methylococcaceae bacterium]|nr:transposase [Methylococcaceae bacterium]
MTGVLHTRGQTLCRHVHLHCLVPGGALSDQGHWHTAKSNHLFPVRALSRHFRGNTVSALRQAATAGELHRITRSGEIDSTLDRLMQT